MGLNMTPPTSAELREFLKKRKLTWDEAAERTHIPRGTWDQWLCDLVTMKPYTWLYIRIMLDKRFRKALFKDDD